MKRYGIPNGKRKFFTATDQILGRCILFNPKLDVHTENIETDKNGRYLMLEAKIYDSTFLFCNIYSPNVIITVKIHSSLVSMGLFDNMLICKSSLEETLTAL